MRSRLLLTSTVSAGSRSQRDSGASNSNPSIPQPCPYLALPLPVCRWAEMTGKSPFAQVLHAASGGGGQRRVSRAWSLAQGDRLIILVCQIMLRNIFWVFATGGDSEFVQRRGEERRHNYVIITLANTRDVRKKIYPGSKWWGGRRGDTPKSSSSPLICTRQKRQEVEMSQLSVRITGAASQPAACVTDNQHWTIRYLKQTDETLPENIGSNSRVGKLFDWRTQWVLKFDSVWSSSRRMKCSGEQLNKDKEMQYWTCRNHGFQSQWCSA